MDEGQNKGRLASWMTKENLKIFGIVNLGTLLLSVGVYFFKFPNHFTTGGVSGISIILGKFFPNISSATFVAAINIILLILGFLFIGRSFGILTAYCSLMYSLETWLFEWLFPMDAPFTDQPLLELCFAIFLPAVGSALLFNYNASSGGTDIVAMILKKYSSIGDIGKALMISDSLIAVSSCFIFGMQVGMFSLLGLCGRLGGGKYQSVQVLLHYHHQTGRDQRLRDPQAASQLHDPPCDRRVFPYGRKGGHGRLSQAGSRLAPASVQEDRSAFLYADHQFQ